jgi:hypothetical protein
MGTDVVFPDAAAAEVIIAIVGAELDSVEVTVSMPHIHVHIRFEFRAPALKQLK